MKLSEIENILALHEKSGISAMDPELLRRLTGLYDQRTTLVNSIEKNYPEYYKAKFNFNVAGLDEIQKMLEEDQVILEYQLLNTEIIIFIISKHDFYIHYQLIDKRVLQELQNIWSVLNIDPSQQGAKESLATFANSSQFLYSILIEPVYDKIINKRLIIIPHNELTQIPFDILISEKPEKRSRSNYRNLKYLIREFPIVYAYSANLLLENKDEKKKIREGNCYIFTRLR